jgi:hypothetical protein
VATSDLILSIVASEQGFLASILSAEVAKTERSAAWISSIANASISAENAAVIISQAVTVECSISNLIKAAADKEIAIAAKVAAVLNNPVGPIVWQPGPICCDSE